MKSEPVSKSEIEEMDDKITLKILHVDDNPEFIDLAANYLKKSQKNFEILRASNAEEALKILDENKVDCVLSDHKMPDKNGLDLLKEIRDTYGNIPFILLTGKGSEEIASKAMSNSATDYFRKKSNAEAYEILAQRIENAVSTYRAKNEREKTLRRINDGFIELNEDYEIKFSNKRAEELLKLYGKDYKGEKFWEYYKDEDSSLSEEIKKSFENQEEANIKEFDPIHNNWFYISIYPSKDSISVYVDDITEREISQKQKEVQRIQQEILAEKAREIVGIDETQKALEITADALWQGIDCQKVSITGEKLAAVKGEEDSSSTAETFDIELKDTKWGEIRLETNRELKENDIQFLESVKSMLANTVQRLDRDKKLKKYQKIVELSDEGLYITDSDSEIEFVNGFFLEMTGLSREDVLGENIADVLNLETDEDLRGKINQLSEEDQTILKDEGVFEKPEGDKLYYENNFKLLNPEEDEFKGTLGLVKDITDHEEKKEDLKRSRIESERERNRLIQNMPGAAFRMEEKNGKWALDYISEGSEQLFGKEPGKIEDDGWESLIIEDDIKKIKERLTELQESPSEQVNFRVENSNGEIKWIMAKGSVVTDGDEKSIEGVLIDITDWKKYEKDLERTQILVEATPEPMFILDNDLVIKRINKAARDAVGVDKCDLIDKNIDEAAEKIAISNSTKILDEAIERSSVSEWLNEKSQLQDLKQELIEFLEQDREETSFEAEIGLDAGNILYRRFELRKIFDSKGNVEGVAGIVHDITDMEKKKRSQKNKLDEFSSLVSHDLRNPLNLAQGYLDLARESESEEDFEVIEKAHNRMENIIDELLLITTEKDEIKKEKVDLSEVFKEAFYFSGSKNLDYEIADDVEIYGDRSGMVSIFENLISNSEEHNQGKVNIKIGAIDEGFYYEDNGKGIPEDKREEIFEYGISSNNSGIGLSIVRRIIEINDWEIKAGESDEGGARFEIRT